MVKMYSAENLTHVKPKERMIYTPIKRIPLGAVTETPSGEKALRIKKPGKEVYEDITVDRLMSMIFNEPA